jgi:hypothetical protein
MMPGVEVPLATCDLNRSEKTSVDHLLVAMGFLQPLPWFACFQVAEPYQPAEIRQWPEIPVLPEVI